MAEFGAGGAGLRDEDRRALKEGKKLLKKALGAAGVLKGGKHKEKLRRERQRRRDEQQARAQAEAREQAARRAELHQRATARALAQKETDTERRCQATERALDGAQRKEQDLREQLRTKEWDLAEAERERARWHADSEQARSTAEAQRSRAEFYVTEAQRRDAAAAIASRQDDAHIDAAHKRRQPTLLGDKRNGPMPIGRRQRGRATRNTVFIDRAVSSLLASKNELKREVRSTCRRLPINNNGHSIVYAMDAVEKDVEAMKKLIQEFRARAHTTTTEEKQRLQLQAAAWRNVEAAQEERQKARNGIDYPPQLCGSDLAKRAHKRLGEALDNLCAARAAAEASTQEGDGDPELYARLQNQHEEYNRRRNRTRGRGGRR